MRDLTMELVVACVFSAFTFLVVAVMEERAFQQAQQAAQTECARYHPETGDFEWLDKQGE